MRISGLVLGLAVGLAAVAAFAQATEEKPLLPGEVHFRRTPDIEARFRYFPNEARQNQVEGRGTVVCRVQDNGLLRDCAVRAESPEGRGFGEATRRLVEAEIQLGKKARDGSPTAGRLFQVTRVFALRSRRDTAQVMPLDPGKIGEDGLRRRWLRPPDAGHVAACFGRAVPNSEDAKVRLRCLSSTDDRLTDCTVVENSRGPDIRYEVAAICAIESARFRVEDKDGKPVAGEAIIVPLGYAKP